MSQSANFVFGTVRAVDWTRVRPLAPLLLIIVVAAGVRAYGIDSQSLWVDELFSRYYPELFTLKYLWTTGLLYESSPPLYYMLIGAWMDLFGTSEVALRSLSLVASVLALPVVYLIGKELLDRRRALVSALILALAPIQIDFAQEARTYALLLIPIGLAMLATARFLHGDLRARTLALYGISVVAALYCHATAIFFIAACNIVVIAAALAHWIPNQRSALLHWLAANAVVGLFALPEIAVIILQGHSGAGIEWIPPFRPVHIVRALSPVIVGVSTPNGFPGAEISAVLVALLGAGMFATRPPRPVWLVLVGIPVAFVVLAALGSLHHSIFITRVFVWLGIPIALLLAHVLVTEWALRRVLAVVTVIAGLTGMGYLYAAPQKEPWRAVFREIGPQLARADHLVLAPLSDPTAFAYYAPYLTRLEMWGAAPENNIENGDLPDRLGVLRVTREQLIEHIRSGADVWLIVRTPDAEILNELLEEVPPPRQRLEWPCGRLTCISALSWRSAQQQRRD